MAQVVLERRVGTLEDLMADLLRASARTQAQIERTQVQVERTQAQVEQTSREMRILQDEMRDFKDEMRAFKDEMGDFKDEMRDFKDEMGAFKDEMGDFKDEMRDFKDETRESRREMNRRWGELANKMGTMAEDLVAPSIPRILRTVVGCPDEAIDSIAVRVRRRHPASRQLQEFDVLAACGEYVLINETKSSLAPEAVTEFVDLLSRAREFFPEYADKKIIGAIASLYVDPGLVRFGEREGLIVLGFGEDVMDVLNSPEFTPTAF